MSASQQALDSYRRTQVQSSTPLEQVVLLYDGALRFMADAKDAMTRHDIVARRTAVSRALAIVGELRGTLDMDRGGEIAISLERLYQFVTERTMDAVMHHDPRAIEQAETVLTTLRDAWRTIAAAKVEPAAPAPGIAKEPAA